MRAHVFPIPLTSWLSTTRLHHVPAAQTHQQQLHTSANYQQPLLVTVCAPPLPHRSSASSPSSPSSPMVIVLLLVLLLLVSYSELKGQLIQPQSSQSMSHIEGPGRWSGLVLGIFLNHAYLYPPTSVSVGRVKLTRSIGLEIQAPTHQNALLGKALHPGAKNQKKGGCV